MVLEKEIYFLHKLKLSLRLAVKKQKIFFEKRQFDNTKLFDLSNILEKDLVKDYLKTYSSEQLKEILIEFRQFNLTKKSLFLNTLDYNSQYYKDPSKKEYSLHRLDREIWRLKKGMINRNLIFETGKRPCANTILGFIRALRAGTVFITKMNIDGEKRFVLVKSEIGHSNLDRFNLGFNSIILDLKTFDLYDCYIPGKSSFLTLKEISKLKIRSIINAVVTKMKDYDTFKKYKPILEKEVKDYVKRHKENTSFEKRHNIKKASLFSKIKKRNFKK
jgi:hypothetical protein